MSSAKLVLGTPLILPGQLLNVPDPQRVDVVPPPARPASHAEDADAPMLHLAGAQFFGAGRWPAVTTSGPICQPLPGGGQCLPTPNWAENGVGVLLSMDCLKVHTVPLLCS
jgi:hypothetical protein